MVSLACLCNVSLFLLVFLLSPPGCMVGRYGDYPRFFLSLANRVVSSFPVPFPVLLPFSFSIIILFIEINEIDSNEVYIFLF